MAKFLAENNYKVENDFYKKDMFLPNSFDLISFIQVLEHIPFPFDNALAIANYHLKKDRYCIIEVPSLQNINYLLYQVTGIKKIVEKNFIYDHCNYFKPSSLSLLAEKAGFKPVLILTGRYSVKSKGLRQKIGYLLDPLFNSLKFGGMLFIAKKVRDIGGN